MSRRDRGAASDGAADGRQRVRLCVCVCVCVCVWWWEWRVVRVSWGPGPVYDCARENRDNNRKCYVWGGVLRSLARSEIE